jgi:hypothetical protein
MVYGSGVSSLRQSVDFIVANALTVTLLEIKPDLIEYGAHRNS